MLVLYAEFNLNQAWQIEKFCQSWYLHSWMENVYVFMGKCDSQQSIKIADIFLNPPFTATGVNQSFVIENATTTNSKVGNSKCHKKIMMLIILWSVMIWPVHIYAAHCDKNPVLMSPTLTFCTWSIKTSWMKREPRNPGPFFFRRKFDLLEKQRSFVNPETLNKSEN